VRLGIAELVPLANDHFPAIAAADATGRLTVVASCGTVTLTFTPVIPLTLFIALALIGAAEVDARTARPNLESLA